MRESVNREMENAVNDFEASLPETPEAIEAEHFLEEFKPARVTAAKISELRAKYGGLTIAGVNDKKGYELVHAARMEIREYRVAVEKVRKTLKEDSLAYGRKVDTEAKRITAKLIEIEEPLDQEESRIDAEKEKIKQEAQRKKEAELQARIDALTAVGAPVNIAEIAMMTDVIFDFHLASTKDAFEAREKVRLAGEEALRLKAEQEAKQAAEREARAHVEKDRMAQEEADRLATVRAAQAMEAERLAALKAEYDRQAAEMRKAQEEIVAQKQAMEQAAREEQIRKDAEAKAKEAAAQEEAGRRAAQEAEAKRKAQAEAARPDAQKILALAEVVRGTAYPKMTTEVGHAAITKIQDAGSRFVKFIENEAKAISDIKVIA